MNIIASKRDISPIPEIIEDCRKGKMVIMVDNPDRENEGDLIIPGAFAGPKEIAFMACEGRGLICFAITAERARRFDLRPMVRNNRDINSTAFTVSVDARFGTTTGISAQDRARTIEVLLSDYHGEADIVTPGHLFPLIADPGGVLGRPGHTEAAVDLARLAELKPAGAICEIIRDDGEMARMPDLKSYAQKHDLKIGTISDLIEYRLRHEARDAISDGVLAGYGVTG